MRALDRFLLAVRVPRARDRAAYRVLVTIAALERTPPRLARAPVRSVDVRSPRRH